MKLSSVPVDFGQVVFRCGHHNTELTADGDKSPLKPVVIEVGRRVPEAGGSVIYEATNKWEIDLSDMFCPWWDSEEGRLFEERCDPEHVEYDKMIEECQNSWEMFQVID